MFGLPITYTFMLIGGGLTIGLGFWLQKPGRSNIFKQAAQSVIFTMDAVAPLVAAFAPLALDYMEAVNIAVKAEENLHWNENDAFNTVLLLTFIGTMLGAVFVFGIKKFLEDGHLDGMEYIVLGVCVLAVVLVQSYALYLGHRIHIQYYQLPDIVIPDSSYVFAGETRYTSQWMLIAVNIGLLLFGAIHGTYKGLKVYEESSKKGENKEDLDKELKPFLI